MVHKILSKDRLKTNKNVKRERERDGERGRWGKGEGEERERERGGEGKGRVMYTILCSFCHNVFRKGGGGSEETNSGMETVKIHTKQ